MNKILSTKKVIGVIPARMASSRFHGKPLAKILGKEMLQWVYEYCQPSKTLKEVYVATDHEDIENFCKKQKIPVVMTSPAHKNCSERSNEVCQRMKADYVVEIQGDEPTLLTSDIDDFVTQALEFKTFDVVTQYTDLTPQQAEDPHNVKIVLGAEQKALFFSRCPIPCNFKNKPMAKYYKQVGLFLWKAGSAQRFVQTPVSYLESIEDTHMLRMVENNFDIRLVYTPKYTVGVDVPGDVKEAEEFLSARKQTVLMNNKG